jgi:hypothetical protein
VIGGQQKCCPPFLRLCEGGAGILIPFLLTTIKTNQKNKTKWKKSKS